MNPKADFFRVSGAEQKRFTRAMTGRVCAAMLALSLAACDTTMANKDSPGYNAGFGDGCATAEAESSTIRKPVQRDAALYEKDPDYRTGWNSGHSFCRPQGRSTGF